LKANCWELKKAQHYIKNGFDEYYDARKESRTGKAKANLAKRSAKADAKADANLDVEYDAILSGKVESGKFISSEYPVQA